MRLFIGLLGFLALAGLPLLPATVHASPAVDALIRRVTPKAATQVQTAALPTSGDKTDRFEIDSANGKVILRGTTPSAEAAAYGWYLKHIANTHLSWGGDQVNLPHRLPTQGLPLRIASPYPHRFAFNYCTLSYTAAFWDWKRWEREIDFLALNGFNQALVTAGLEKVWRDTLRELGYPEDRIRAYIASPAYAAWWHMGNLQGEGGPISDTQIENEAKLGRQITDRMRTLGITPVLTGFVGLLPDDIGTYVPGLDILPQGKWAANYQRPAVLNPTSPAFERVAAVWYRNLHRVYGGPSSAYSGDLFHEGGRPGDTPLKDAARNVQAAMQSASPGSVWVLQGWQSNPVPALLSGLDPKKTEILQLCRDMKNGTNGSPLRKYDGFPWLWCEVLNFGGRQGLYGGLPLLANLPAFLLDPADKQGDKGNIAGIGMLSEGIEQNPIYYDLLFDTLWREKPVNLTAWTDDYALRRYGKKSVKARKALDLLLSSGVYAAPQLQEGPTESILCARPSRDARKASSWSHGEVYYNADKITQAALTLLEAAPELKSQETYRYDLTDWTRQVIVEMARFTLADAMAAYDRGDLSAFDHYVAQYLFLLRDSDRLLASDRHFLLGDWIARARAKGTNPVEKARMERNARTLVTTWSGRIDALNDYSHRQWSGLMRDYYLPRWEAFFADYRSILTGKLPPESLDNWYKTRRASADIAFADAVKRYPSQAQGDTVKIAAELLQKYAPLSRTYSQRIARTTGFTWKLGPGVTHFAFDVNEKFLQAGTYRASFQWKTGQSALKIHSVALYEGEKMIAEDIHEGWTGTVNRQNTYTIELRELRTSLESYTLRVEVSGASGTDSAGVLNLEKIE